ncbi:MAG: metal ABC transporter permease [Beijerinckiaceae bacterium]|nr:metal ABC transporter permease [Beijerinckiaceae bacterium]
MTNLASIFDLLITPFVDFAFMRRALVGSIALSIGACPIGVFLMLRRMSLVGDAMAHAILPGAALGYLFAGLSLGFMTAGGLIAGFVVALLAGLVTRVTVLKEDAALASFYLISLAGGVVLVSLRGSNVDLLHVLFGSVLALDDNTLMLLAVSTTVSLLSLAVLFRPLVLECVDPLFLRTVSKSGSLSHFSVLALGVLNLVAGFHALGTLLSVGLMMVPAFASRFWSSTLDGMIAIATLIGILSSGLGIVISYHAGTPTGPTIILSAGALYLLSILFGQKNGLILRLWPRKHLAA